MQARRDPEVSAIILFRHRDVETSTAFEDGDEHEDDLSTSVFSLKPCGGEI